MKPMNARDLAIHSGDHRQGIPSELPFPGLSLQLRRHEMAICKTTVVLTSLVWGLASIFIPWPPLFLLELSGLVRPSQEPPLQLSKVETAPALGKAESRWGVPGAWVPCHLPPVWRAASKVHASCVSLGRSSPSCGPILLPWPTRGRRLHILKQKPSESQG